MGKNLAEISKGDIHGNGNGYHPREKAMEMAAVWVVGEASPETINHRIEITEEALYDRAVEVIELCEIDSAETKIEIVWREGSLIICLIDFPKNKAQQFTSELARKMHFERLELKSFIGPEEKGLCEFAIKPRALYR